MYNLFLLVQATFNTKKIVILIFLIFCSIFAYSQVPVILFSEDFDGISGSTSGGSGTYAFPNGWFLRNVDNKTPDPSVSYVNDAWERREDFKTNVLDSVVFSTSWYSPTGQADDWMWTPLISGITSNTTLKWNATAYDPSFPDGYEVRIMTSAQGPPTGGNGVMGNQLTNSTQVFVNGGENDTWTARQVDISSYAGQNIYVGFRNNSNDQFLLVIDDVVVESNASPNEVNLSVSSTSVAEGDMSVITVTAIASAAVTANETVTLTVTGSNITTVDYTLNTMIQNTVTITIPNGMTMGTATFSVFDDTVIESLETAVLTISNPSAGLLLGTTTSRMIHIEDNDIVNTATLYNRAYLKNNGLITVQGKPYINTGKVDGKGTFIGSFVNNGGLSPGNN